MRPTCESLVRPVVTVVFIVVVFTGVSILSEVNSVGISLANPLNSPPLVLVPLQDVQQIAAGAFHTCALSTGGDVKCWGHNGNGQLGDGTNLARLTPSGVANLSGIRAVATGGFHTCALSTGGGVQCWGYNGNGQLGDGSNIDRLTPVGGIGLNSGISAVATGGYHTCALTTGGGVLCWGRNNYGQLGDSTLNNRQTPVNVTGLSSGVLAIATGTYHTCALLTNGSVKCWGYNSDGELGDGTTTHRSVPVVTTVVTVTASALVTGDYHTCILTTTSAVKCWGNNGNGQLGGFTTALQATHHAISPSAPSCEFAAHSSAHLEMTQASDCNSNGQGNTQLGTEFAQAGQTYTAMNHESLQGLHAPTLSNAIKALALGGYHSCALTTTGGVQCWGYNGNGQLGDGANLDRSTPVNVVGLSSGVLALASGRYHTCALIAGGTVQCWGMRAAGQVGDTNTPDSRLPSDVIGLSNGIKALAPGDSHTCALTTGGAVKCWGWNYYGRLGDGTSINRQAPVNVLGLGSGIRAVAAGLYHTCALTTGDGVLCWGHNIDGQLGDNTNMDRLAPVAVIGLSNGVNAVATGGYHTCALTTGGGVQCWGYNGDGQLGDGTFTSHQVPVNVAGLGSGVIAITAGERHSCALLSGGGVQCWGRNGDGQLGDNTNIDRQAPVNVTGLNSGVKALTAGNYHTCALLTNGSVKCWGYNGNGQLGDGSTTSNAQPVNVVGMSNGIATISAGFVHTCALTTGGSAKCWGANGDGALGDGTNTDHHTPGDVIGLNNSVSAVMLGSYHTCVLTTGSGAKCWGWNGGGQLGNGNAWRLTPVAVMVETVATPTSTDTPTSTSTATPTNTPTSTPTATPVTPSTDTATPTVTPPQGQADGTATPTPTLTSTPPTSGVSSFVYLSIVRNEVVTLPPQPQWQQIGQAGLDANTLAVSGNQLFMGERRKDNGRPGGLYVRSLTTCDGTPTFTRIDAINNTSVLGLAFQGTQGVAATYDVNVFYSNDTGNHWTQTTSAFRHSGTVAIAGGSVFYIGTQDKGIYQSNNGGLSWESLPTNPPPPQDINVLKLDTGTLWIGAETGAWKLTLTGLIPVIAGLNDETSKQVWDFAFHAANDIYIATFNGVYHGDGANAWQSFGLAGKNVYSLELYDNFLYAGTRQNGVWRRELDSNSWEEVTSPGWSSTTTVRDLLYNSSNCPGLLAATDNGVWIYR